MFIWLAMYLIILLPAAIVVSWPLILLYFWDQEVIDLLKNPYIRVGALLLLILFGWSLYYIRRQFQNLWALTIILWGTYLGWRGLSEFGADNISRAIAMIASVMFLVDGFQSLETAIKDAADKWRFVSASDAALRGPQLFIEELTIQVKVFLVAMIVAVGFSVWFLLRFVKWLTG